MLSSLSLVLAAIGPLGLPEILILFFVIMLLFGAKRLPDLAKGLGKSLREFKKASNEEQEAEETPKATPAGNGTSEKSAKAEAAHKD